MRTETAELGARYAREDATRALEGAEVRLHEIESRTPEEQRKLGDAMVIASRALSEARADKETKTAALEKAGSDFSSQVKAQEALDAATSREADAKQTYDEAAREFDAKDLASELVEAAHAAVERADDAVFQALDQTEQTSANLVALTGTSPSARVQRRADADGIRSIRDAARMQRFAAEAIERAEGVGDRATRSLAGRLVDYVYALADQYKGERGVHADRSATLSADDQAMATLRRQQDDGIALGPVDRAYLRRLEQDAPGRQAERKRMTKRALTVAKTLQKALRRLIARLKRKTSGDPNETQKQIEGLEADLAAIDKEIATHTAQLAELSKPKKKPKKKPTKKVGKMPGAPPPTDDTAPSYATMHVPSSVAASISERLSGLLGADALAWAARGVLHPLGGLYSSWASFALSGGPDDPRTIATSSQGFASQSMSQSISPPAVPPAVAAACKPECCANCPPGQTCACPPPAPIVAEGTTVTVGAERKKDEGTGGGGGGGKDGPGGGGYAGPGDPPRTASPPPRPPPELNPPDPTKPPTDDGTTTVAPEPVTPPGGAEHTRRGRIWPASGGYDRIRALSQDQGREGAGGVSRDGSGIRSPAQSAWQGRAKGRGPGPARESGVPRTRSLPAVGAPRSGHFRRKCGAGA